MGTEALCAEMYGEFWSICIEEQEVSFAASINGAADTALRGTDTATGIWNVSRDRSRAVKPINFLPTGDFIKMCNAGTNSHALLRNRKHTVDL